jgi:hypothetical protein
MINVPVAANQTTLHLECDNKTRRFYMIRSRVDFQGNLHEENRTCFHRPEWLKLNDKKWVQKRDHFSNKFAETMRQGIKETGYGVQEVQL